MFVERAQLGFPELDPDDTLDFLGYRGRVSVHGEISNSAVEEVDEDNNNNTSNNNNVNSGASSAVNEDTNFRVYLYRFYENRLKEERELRKMIRELFIEKLKEVEKERDKEKEGRVIAEEELKRTKKMLEEVRKKLDDERRGREAADEPEMPEEGRRPDRDDDDDDDDDSPDSSLLSVNELPDDDDGNINLAARGDVSVARGDEETTVREDVSKSRRGRGPRRIGDIVVALIAAVRTV